MSLVIAISYEAAAVLEKLGRFTPRLKEGIAQGFDLQNQFTIGHAQATYLTGPRPQRLGVRTNRLRSSLSAAPTLVTDDRITTAIGTNVRYAGAHERGFDGTVKVQAHTRTATRHATVGGSALDFDMRTGRIKKRTKKITIRGTTHTVKEHSRHMVLPPRPFLAPSLRDRASAYGDAISNAVLNTWNDPTA